MTLLVTGGAGFIGASFVRERRRAHPDEPLVVLDLLTYAGHRASLAGVPGVTLVEGDVADPAAVARVFADHDVRRVVHLAAETHVDRSLHDPQAFVRSNVLGTSTLLEAAKRAGVSRFVHVSTDEVYGDLGPDEPPFSTASPLRPRSPYAASKAGADHLVLAQVSSFGVTRVPATIVRLTNCYGPFQFPEKLLPLAIHLAGAGRPVPIYGDGSNVRDWLFVEDAARGLSRVLDAGAPGAVVHLAGGQERRNLDVVHALLDALGRPRDLVRFVRDRPGHDRRYALATDATVRDLGFAPEVSLSDGLARTVAWYAAHGEWVRTVTAGGYEAWLARHYGTLA